MDKAGRIVVPLELRKRIGLVPGIVDIDAYGVQITIAQPAVSNLVERDGRLLIDAPDAPNLTTEEIRELRLADQR